MLVTGLEPAVVGLACVLWQAGQARDEPRQTPVVIARVENIREAPSSLYCECNQISGRNLVFDLNVENRLDSPAMVYAFVWAGNDEVVPVERGLWPVSAVDRCLTRTGELDVKDPTRGARIELQPNGCAKLKSKSILQPIGWFEGELVSFRTLRVEVWSADAGRLFVREFRLDCRQQEAKPTSEGKSGGPLGSRAARGPASPAGERSQSERSGKDK